MAAPESAPAQQRVEAAPRLDHHELAGLRLPAHFRRREAEDGVLARQPCVGNHGRNDVNGRTFALNAPAGEYCEYILNLMRNYGMYRRLALSAFAEYQSRLNWSVAGRTVKKLMLEIAA